MVKIDSPLTGRDGSDPAGVARAGWHSYRAQMAQAFRTLAQKPFASHYFYCDAVIDHPVERVWPHALNIASWMTDHRLETIDGASGHVGHFERVWAGDIDPATTPEPHYHLYGISQIVPHKLIVLEVFPEFGGSYGSMKDSVGFDAMVFTNLGDATSIAFVMIEVETGEDGNNDEAWAETQEIATERIRRYFDNLRELVEST
jgi:hypothetical protein